MSLFICILITLSAIPLHNIQADGVYITLTFIYVGLSKHEAFRNASSYGRSDCLIRQKQPDWPFWRQKSSMSISVVPSMTFYTEERVGFQ